MTHSVYIITASWEIVGVLATAFTGQTHEPFIIGVIYIEHRETKDMESAV